MNEHELNESVNKSDEQGSDGTQEIPLNEAQDSPIDDAENKPVEAAQSESVDNTQSCPNTQGKNGMSKESVFPVVPQAVDRLAVSKASQKDSGKSASASKSAFTGKVDKTPIPELLDEARPNKYFPFILLLFIASGCSALIYEIVWFQRLQFVIGSSSVSLGVLLGIYMGGMCIGSMVLPKIITSRLHPLGVYAFLELGIGLIGIGVMYALPYVDEYYLEYSTSRQMDILMRAGACAVILLPPTLLMGATLPAIARWVETTKKGASQLGFFYAGNIIGAVIGCLLAGFYLLRVYDLTVTTYTAVGINLSVFVVGFILSFVTPYKRQKLSEKASLLSTSKIPGGWAIYLGICLSGLTALGAEVVWTRLLSLLMGGTVYTFSIILAMFLMGLGIGSSLGSVIARYARNSRMAFGFCQLLLAGAIAWTAYMCTSSLPYWPINPALSSNAWYTFQLDMLRSFWAVFPAACLWGASFPIAIAAITSEGQDSGKVVGKMYAVNTIGAVIGAVCFSMVVIPMLGTQMSQRILIGIAAVSGSILLVPVFWPLAVNLTQYTVKSSTARYAGLAVVVASVVGAAYLVMNVAGTPWGLIAYGRYVPSVQHELADGIVPIEDVPSGSGMPDTYCVYAAEGRDISVAVTKRKNGVLSFHGAGKIQASSDPYDMRLQRMLGHISAVLHDKPESVLVVACGAGVTAGSFVPHPEVKRIVICDIEPLVPANVAPLFANENHDVVNDPRTEVVCDDGRHYIHTSNEKFDIITSDPIDPWTKGTAALNSEQYFTMCKEHLKPGGVMSLWMPFYENSPESAKSLVSTFFKVFPNGVIWSNDANGYGYDSVLFGTVEPLVIDLDKLKERFEREDHYAVVQSLQQVGFYSVEDLLSTYAGRAKDLGPWMADAQINTDNNLRLQYLAGMGLNTYQETEILYDILQYYQFPKDIFVGSKESVAQLELKLDTTR